MPDLVSQPQKVGDSGLNMLRSGQFTDAEVVCEERTWKVHRIIVCTRCEFFDKALNGPFKEADEKRVVINGFTSDDVDMLLSYIYSGEVHFEGSYMEMCVKLAAIGDYFLLGGLQDLAVSKLGRFLDDVESNDEDNYTDEWKAVEYDLLCVGLTKVFVASRKYSFPRKYCRVVPAGTTNPSPGLWELESDSPSPVKSVSRMEFVGELCVAVRLAYQVPNVTQAVFADYVLQHRDEFFPEPELQQLAAELYEFGSHLAVRLMKGPQPQTSGSSDRSIGGKARESESSGGKEDRAAELRLHVKRARARLARRPNSSIRSGGQPSTRSGGQPSTRSGGQPSTRSGGQPSTRSGGQPSTRSGGQSSTRPRQESRRQGPDSRTGV